MMMKLHIASYLVLLVTTSGCSALKTLSSQNNANNAPSASASNSNGPTFIDNIAITPGTSTEPAATMAGTRRPAPAAETPKREKTINTARGETNPAVLQMKYATILEVNADKLNNIALLRNLDHWWGTQYLLGGEDENGIDCSAFTQTMLRDVYALNIPRNAQEQYDSTERVDDKRLREGDLVFFHTTGRGNSVTHVGVYVTNNHFAHASTTGGVTVSALDDPYWKLRYVGAGRVKANGVAAVSSSSGR